MLRAPRLNPRPPVFDPTAKIVPDGWYVVLHKRDDRWGAMQSGPDSVWMPFALGGPFLPDRRGKVTIPNDEYFRARYGYRRGKALQGRDLKPGHLKLPRRDVAFELFGPRR